MKKQNNKVVRYEKTPGIKNKPLSKYYDNEFADDYEIDSRQLELEHEQIEKFTENPNLKKKSNKGKTAR